MCAVGAIRILLIQFCWTALGFRKARWLESQVRNHLQSSCAFASREHVYDAVIIGGGPAGVAAALQARALDHSVLLVESNESFGLPSGAYCKALRTAVEDGLRNWDEIQEHARHSMGKAQAQVKSQLKAAGVQLVRGTASLLAGGMVQVQTVRETCRINASATFIATGSYAYRPPGIPSADDNPQVFDSDTLGSMRRIPDHLVIKGGSTMALEFASIFSKLTKVTMLVRSTIGKSLDEDVLREFLKQLSEHDVVIKEDNDIANVSRSSDGLVEIDLLQPSTKNRIGTLKCDALLVAAGRRGRSSGIGLEAAGIAANLKGGFISNDQLQSQNATAGKFYALGDIAGGSMANTAKMQAHEAVLRWSPRAEARDKTRSGASGTPIALWTIPAIAYAVDDASVRDSQQNFDYAIAKFSDSFRGMLSDEKGFLKLVYSKPSGQIHQVHIFGKMANDLIEYGAECVSQKKTVHDMVDANLPSLTFHELYSAAAMKAEVSLRRAAASVAAVPTADNAARHASTLATAASHISTMATDVAAKVAGLASSLNSTSRLPMQA